MKRTSLRRCHPGWRQASLSAAFSTHLLWFSASTQTFSVCINSPCLDAVPEAGDIQQTRKRKPGVINELTVWLVSANVCVSKDTTSVYKKYYGAPINFPQLSLVSIRTTFFTVHDIYKPQTLCKWGPLNSFVIIVACHSSSLKSSKYFRFGCP